jgi:hypothetical protein
MPGLPESPALRRIKTNRIWAVRASNPVRFVWALETNFEPATHAELYLGTTKLPPRRPALLPGWRQRRILVKPRTNNPAGRCGTGVLVQSAVEHNELTFGVPTTTGRE